MKRANGTGTVVRLSGNRRKPYAVKVPTRDKRGYVVQRLLSYHTKQAEAQAALDDYNAKRATMGTTAPDMLNYTVQDVYDGWSFREYAKLEKAGRSSSLYAHKSAWKKRVSRLADCKMRDTVIDQWQRILDEDEDEGKSQSLINNDAILIRNLYSYAMERDIVAKDYSQFLDIPSVDPKEQRGALDDLQLAKLEKMAIEGFPWADTVLMLCYTGYRITEFLMLTPFQYREDLGGYFTAGIKTAAGRDRIVPIHAKIKPYLARWLERCEETIIADGSGRALIPQWYRPNCFDPVVAALGIPEVTPHWCRHTFNTRLHAAGVDDITRKLLVGHSLKGDTNAGYTHPDVKMLVEAVQKLA